MIRNLVDETPWIAESSRAFESAFAAGDIEQLLHVYYAPNLVMINDGQGEFHGHAGARQFFNETIGHFRGCMFRSDSVQAVGRRYIEVGSVSLLPRQAEQPAVKLDYAVVWAQVPDLGYRVVVDFFTPGHSP